MDFTLLQELHYYKELQELRPFISNFSSIHPSETFFSLWDGFVMTQSNYNSWKNSFCSCPALRDIVTLSERLSNLH